MTEKKVETIIYEGLGFPIQLVDVPMKKIFGEWVLDINFNTLQIETLKLLIHQLTPLQAEEIRFIRKYFEMTTTDFGKALGVSHVAVLKWERGQLPSPAMDLYIRMYMMDRLNAKDAEFGKLYHEIKIETLMQTKKEGKKTHMFRLDARHHRLTGRRRRTINL